MSLALKLVKIAVIAYTLSALLANQVYGQEFLSSLEKDVTSLVVAVKPSLVTINTKRSVPGRTGLLSNKKTEGEKKFGREKITRIGSGIIFDKQGYIVTSASVVSGGDEFEIILTDGRRLKGDLAGVDLDRNLAVLKVSAPNLVPARIGNSDLLKAGSWITILGNSYGIPTAVAVGLCNGVRPDGFIQMSASVAPGNSGGPVVNSKGEVVGLVSAKVSETSSISFVTDEDGRGVKVVGTQGFIDFPSSSVSLAVPINQVKRVTQEIIQHGSRQKGFLGVYPEDAPGGAGILVSEVVENSPAAKAGILPGDVLVYLNGRKLSNTDQFRRVVSETQPNTEVDLKLLRNSRMESLKTQLAPLPEGFAPTSEFNWDFGNFEHLSNLQNWDAGPDLHLYQQASFDKAAQEQTLQLQEFLKQARQQLVETQKASSAYNSSKMENRITELEKQVEMYRRALDSLRLELKQVKASQEGP
jgi:S1-C subfamily serine protease